MIIRCKFDTISKVANNQDLHQALLKMRIIADDKLSLTVGRHYVVYAIQMDSVFPKLFIADDVFSYYPKPYYLPLFDVVDERFSRFWRPPAKYLTWKALNQNDEIGKQLIAFKEWVWKGDLFFERLFDGMPQEIELFSKYKKAMDMEFAPPDLKDLANRLEGSWIQCSLCFEAWECDDKNELVKCPECHSILRNSQICNDNSSQVDNRDVS